eukprot:TRINITY_DN548_c0_g1_i1.p1 TRINITY_DN548_c0_g1~~TRINITY_DN548_c0_g1_i1.p1  ORF type:complete len:399 (+),score=57.14 TRINITY_DN548_c0_g1_i1:69-1265(+)
MVVTPYQIQERNMIAVTGSGPEYWLVDAKKSVAEKTLPTEEGVTDDGNDGDKNKTPEKEEREEKFTKWTSRTFRAGDGESEAGPWGQSEYEMGRDGISQCNVRLRPEVDLSEEVWSISHMSVLLSFWVIIFVIGVWEFTIWYSHRNDVTTDESCDRLVVYFLISSVGSLLIFPFVMFICVSSIFEVDKRRLKKLAGLQVPQYTRHALLMSTWLSWGRTKLFVTCLVFVASVLEYFWVLSGVMFLALASDCGTTYDQGVYLYFVLTGFVIMFSLGCSIIATYVVIHKSSHDDSSVKQSYPRSFHSRSPSYFEERPHSPKPSALAALRALKHGHSKDDDDGDDHKHHHHSHHSHHSHHKKHKHGHHHYHHHHGRHRHHHHNHQRSEGTAVADPDHSTSHI